MNWKELKDFCNSLPESELEKKVILWREEEAITKITAEQLEEDNYVLIDSEEDGCFPEKEALSQIKNNLEEFPKGLKHFKKVYNKGNPILYENF